VLLAAWNGPDALVASPGGAAVGGLVVLPSVWWEWPDGADALLLAAPDEAAQCHELRVGRRAAGHVPAATPASWATARAISPAS
jgi:hypothetical protein